MILLNCLRSTVGHYLECFGMAILRGCEAEKLEVGGARSTLQLSA